MAKREEYSIFTIAGRVNAGKSSLLNLLSGQRNFAIVDPTPGTTADTVVTRMEIHDLGPVKVLDTAGVNEDTELGEKKRKKTYEAVEEADLTLIVVNLLDRLKTGDFSAEKEIAAKVNKFRKQALVVYNIFNSNVFHSDYTREEELANKKLGIGAPSIAVDASDSAEQAKLVAFIKFYFKKPSQEVELLPLTSGHGFVLLNIPMDEETPALRLLRPQDMAMERLLRKYLVPVLFRMDLSKARSDDAAEKDRYLSLIKHLEKSPEGLKLVITDSQAMDIIDQWTPAEIPLTTFSVMMTNYMSGGNLPLFMSGLEVFCRLVNGDKIMIMESCNHDRKCDDIGTRQIPRLIKAKLRLDLQYDFCFGRVMPENFKPYKLVIHCGGCMADRQKYMRRIAKLQEAGVPVTNYGLFLSWIYNPQAAKRVASIFN